MRALRGVVGQGLAGNRPRGGHAGPSAHADAARCVRAAGRPAAPPLTPSFPDLSYSHLCVDLSDPDPSCAASPSLGAFFLKIFTILSTACSIG